MIRGLAHAKVNLGLRVQSVRGDGFHPLQSVFQSIGWSDRLEVAAAEEDTISGWDGGPVPDGPTNLALRAAQEMRDAAGASVRISIRLRKDIPVAAGLGGGSADAAAALHMTARLLGFDPDRVGDLAPRLGSDVPFCATGGTAAVTGRGDVIDALPLLSGFAFGLVVPPVELATPAVFAAWDRLGEPTGPESQSVELPPAVRPYGPLVNDLYPAAVDLVPDLEEWRQELAARWGRAVFMSGSGPTLFGFFVDTDEAAGALDVIPPGARAAHAADPVATGWALDEETRSD